MDSPEITILRSPKTVASTGYFRLAFDVPSNVIPTQPVAMERIKTAEKAERLMRILYIIVAYPSQ
jgi:hypothetical protein